MPQPFSQVSKSRDYVLGNDILGSKPELGALVAKVIAGWSITEAHLGNAFAALIGARLPAAMSMYAALRSFDAQRDVFNAAARELMPKRYADIVEVTITVISREARERHKFAHWIWGWPPKSTQPISAAL